MELMKMLILGAKGMLGRQLGEVFKDLNPVCWDKEEIDITDEAMVKEKIAALRQAQGCIDVVINAAAYTDVDGAEAHREAAFAVNERGVKNLAQVAKDIGARLVHYSTDYVFPSFAKATEGKSGLFDEEGKFLGFPEDYPPGPPVNVYGESKLAGERALAEIAPEFFLLRTAWLYGPSFAQPSLRLRLAGKATAGKQGGKNFVDTMLRLAKEKDLLSVVDDQWGSPTFTKDVAGATREIITGEYQPGVYHTVNEGIVNWYEFARKIFELAGIKIAVEPITLAAYPRPAARPKYSVLKNTKGPILRPWPEALKDYLGQNP